MSRTILPLSDRRRRHQQTSGVALVITLTMLAIVALLAIAFVMTARTELKSGSAFSDQVAARALAKMAVDRALMEIVRQNNDTVVSGTTNYISGILNYAASDLTQLDNYTNDTSGAFQTGSVTNRGDFIDLNQAGPRTVEEPYWIGVRTNTGSVVFGRFAYIAYSYLVDINAIGNIAGTNETYQRYGNFPGNTNLAGYLGKNAPPQYTRGICSDVNLARFLEKLGYGGAGSTNTAADSARQILLFRFGWNPTLAVPARGSGLYLPGIEGLDNNGNGVTNDPSEFTVSPSTVGNDQAISTLGQLDSLPVTAQNPIAPDPAHTNLAAYAATISSESNLTNGGGKPRVNLNAMLTAGDVPTLMTMLTNSGITNNREQISVNLIDFHTTSRYPTVYYNASTNVFIGVKPTPYLNQIVVTNSIMIIHSRTTNIVGSVTNLLSYMTVVVTNRCVSEIWNPYSGAFPDPLTVFVTNSIQMVCMDPVGYTNIITNATFVAQHDYVAPTAASSIRTIVSAVANIFSFNNLLYSTNAAIPPGLVVTQNVSSASLYGNWPAANLINLIQGGQTTVQANLMSNSPPLNFWLANGYSVKTNYYTVILNLEADDPRMNSLYVQANSANNYSIGKTNTATMSLTTNNTVAPVYPDSGPREGLPSFYVKTNDYVTIGEVGYVHRGDPWATIRLSVNLKDTPGKYPNDGAILDNIRVNDLTDVAGRINLNTDTDGPLGVNQSPAFFALFSGLTHPSYTSTAPSNTITDAKILTIINQMATYRRTRLNGGQTRSIGSICNIESLSRDLTETDISATNDADREKLIRDIAPLLTAHGGGTANIIGWGQVVKGGTTPGVMVVIKATYQNIGGKKIGLTSFQYNPQ